MKDIQRPPLKNWQIIPVLIIMAPFIIGAGIKYAICRIKGHKFTGQSVLCDRCYEIRR